MPSEQDLFARGFVQEQRWYRGKEFFVLCELRLAEDVFL